MHCSSKKLEGGRQFLGALIATILNLCEILCQIRALHLRFFERQVRICSLAYLALDCQETCW